MIRIGIAFVVQPENGGEFQYAKMVAEAMLSYQKPDTELIALCGAKYWERWSRKNHIHYVRLFENGWGDLDYNMSYYSRLVSKVYGRNYTEIGQIIDSEKIDVMIYTSQRFLLYNYGIIQLIPEHDLMHKYEIRFEEVATDVKLRDQMYSSQAKYADCIFVDSVLGKKHFEESYLCGRKDKRVKILPYAVSLSKETEKRVDTPHKYVFYPAQFWQHKNHINLVKAINILKNKLPDIHLILVGSEKNAYQDIKNYIEKKELGAFITILGFVEDSEIKWLYKNATIMVMPTYFGPTNIPPLEAMALGCPVAVSGNYAMSEQVGEAGLVFNPDSPEEIADCIYMVWTDDDLRNDMIQKGLQRAKKWTEEDFKNAFIRIVEDVINTK